MSALTDADIIELRKLGFFSIEPFIPDNLQPASIDLTLHNKIEVFEPKNGVIDPSSDDDKYWKSCFRVVDITDDGYDLKPGAIITAQSAELISMPSNLNGIITNRNSLAKIGINANISSYINPGFKGHKIIVIKNEGPVTIKLKPGLRICQLILFKLNNNTIRDYSNRHDENLIWKYKDVASSNAQKQKSIDNALSRVMNESIEKFIKSL